MHILINVNFRLEVLLETKVESKLRPWPRFVLGMGDRIRMSITIDSPSDETSNRGPLALLLR